MKGYTQSARTCCPTPIAAIKFWSSVFVDVEKLCYFIEISMLLPIFDDLEEGSLH